MTLVMMTINKHDVLMGKRGTKNIHLGLALSRLALVLLNGAVLTHEIMGKSLSLSAFPVCKVRVFA